MGVPQALEAPGVPQVPETPATPRVLQVPADPLAPCALNRSEVGPSCGPPPPCSPVNCRTPGRRTRANSTVTVVGAGMAGLVAAYELERLGFRTEALEGGRRPGGRTVRRGDRPLLVPGSARFPDPDRLDIHRDACRHRAFVLGIRSCVGAELARAEAEIGLGVLLDRLPALGPSRLPPTARHQHRHRTGTGATGFRELLPALPSYTPQGYAEERFHDHEKTGRARPRAGARPRPRAAHRHRRTARLRR
ncbi:NAD(P)-binding protein [Streptomyces sp. NPDC004284]|uniref:NAD(P)-binding protein n=1 Tax=Streptomyces sp. NPDC004284 TaxID=3364695 RepID=UPI0036881ADA